MNYIPFDYKHTRHDGKALMRLYSFHFRNLSAMVKHPGQQYLSPEIIESGMISASSQSLTGSILAFVKLGLRAFSPHQII